MTCSETIDALCDYLFELSTAFSGFYADHPVLKAEPDVRAAFTRAWASDDLAEGMAAFRERRPPTFRGR